MTNRTGNSAPPSDQNRIQDWLLSPPTAQAIAPPVATRGQRLPFLELSWENFERLCCRLTQAKGNIEAAWPYGERGQNQSGIDILARVKDGGYEVWQTKRYRQVKPAEITAAVDLFLKHVWAERARRFVLVFACPLEKTRVIDAIEAARNRLKDKNIEFTVYGVDTLTEALIAHPDIIDVFFERAWVRHVCPPEAVRALENRAWTGTTDVSASRSMPEFVQGPGDERNALGAALIAQGRTLDSLVEKQGQLATKKDIAGLVRTVEPSVIGLSTRIPTPLADRLLREELAKTLSRRGFGLADTPRELAELAERAAQGDLSLGSPDLRADVCERAARAKASMNEVDRAQSLRDRIVALAPTRDLFILDALLKEGAGDADAALRLLREHTDVDARSAFFGVLLRQRGAQAALNWMKDEQIIPADLNAAMAVNVATNSMAVGAFDTALHFIMETPPAYFDECAALYLLRAQLRIASILPPDQKGVIRHGLPNDPRQLDLAGGIAADAIKDAALADLRTLYERLGALDLEPMASFLSELILWLRLELVTERASAQLELARKLADPKTTLRHVRLALAYRVPFDIAALTRSLDRKKELGGWTSDERFAALLLVMQAGDAKTIVQFFETHHDDLFTQTDMPHAYLATIEVEALARSGRFSEARRELDRHAGMHLSEEEVTFLGGQIAAIEAGDEGETLRQRYAATGELADLRMLVALSRSRRNDALLAEFAPKLARITRRHEDFDVALKASYVEQCDQQAVGLCDEMPELMALDREYAAIKAWALFRLGRIVEASGIARELVSSRSQQSDNELAINCAIETGDWNYLQTVVAKALDRLATLSATDAMRMARLGLECGSPYVDRFRDAALAKAPDDPEINIAAYSLATDRGEEARGMLAQQWFERAVAHSSPEGPVKQVALHDLVDHASGWRERAEHIDKMLRTGEAPLFVAARASGRRLLDLTLGQARRNHGRRARLNVPVFAFSGGKSGASLPQSANVAIDITALATLHDVGLLDQALSFFDRVVLAPSTFRLLFTERQFLRVRQPSQVAKARRIQNLIAAGQLKIAPASGDCNPGDKLEVGVELAELFAQARGTGGLVVRSAPILKVGSYLEDSADVAAHAAELTDTRAVLACLSENGMIDKARREAAEHYLRRVDQGWDAAPAVEKSSLIYLDDLTVTYLDFVDILEPLTKTVAGVFVHRDVERDVRATLQQATDAEGMLTSIEQIREIVGASVTRGHAVFCRRHRDDEGGDPDERSDMVSSPTLDLLSDLHGIDATIADDRCLNKENNWTDQHGHVALSATSLDILSALRAGGRISQDEFWQARDHLRRAGYYGVPLLAEELSYHLKDVHVRDGAIVETPELAAIRESIAQPLLTGAFVPREVVWLAGIQFELCKAIRAIWASDLAEGAARAKADWLLRLLPDPRAWRVNMDEEISCLLGQRQLATRAAVLMVFTSGTRTRQRQYAQWLDESLTGPLREDYPEIWDATLEVLKSYLDQLWGAEPPLPQRRGDLFAGVLVDPLPPAARMKLLLDSAFCAKHHISPQFWCPLTAGVSAESHSLHNALRAAIARRKRATLKLNGGLQTRVNVGRGKNGIATVDFRGERFLFLDADLLSVERRTRVNALRRALGMCPIAPAMETHWRSVIQERALTDREYADLKIVLGETPEAFKSELKKPQDLNGTILVPNAPALYECLVPRLDTSTDLLSFIEQEFRQARTSILARNAVIGLRRMAYTALWRALIPFELLAATPSESLSALLTAEDPFSLLFGFEVCAARVTSDPSFVDLGQAFLEKLFADRAACNRRCEIFAAAALVAVTRMRSAAKASQAPVFWLRLTALAHAGLITDAASKDMDAEGFLDWACRNFLPQYTWQGVVDRCAAPRWRPEWISPEHLVAELLGRAQGALHTLPAAERPASWVSVIDDVVKRLLDSGRLVASIFPGPFDDFSDQQSALGEMFHDVERSLNDAVNLSDVSGLVALAYASRPSEQVSESVLRILKAGGQRTVVDPKAEIEELRVATHVALVARSEAIGEAVVARCFTLAREAASEDMATAIFLVMVEACAVYECGQRYTERLESVAAGMCFAIDDANSLARLLLVFEVLGQRDASLLPALAKASAIAETKLGRA